MRPRLLALLVWCIAATILAGRAGAGDLEARIRSATGLALSSDLVPPEARADLPRRLLEALRFVEPAPPSTWRLGRGGRDVASLASSFTVSGTIREVGPRGAFLPPLEPGTAADRTTSVGFLLREPPPTGLVLLRLVVARSKYVGDDVPAPRLVVSVGERRCVVDVDGTEERPQVVDLGFFLEDAARSGWRSRPDDPEVKGVDVRISNVPTAPLPEAVRKDLALHRKDREAKSPIPWLVLSGVEVEVAHRAEWFGPAEKRALAADPDGARLALDRAVRDLLGPQAPSDDVSRARAAFELARTEGATPDAAVRRALLPLLTRALRD